ncbi:type I-E CRISPR-associated protein Cas5/CasD [Oceanobacter sp. 5_MG-2023]|uniref:type I-E CRISPR-associated protein Cas5/CasD n=1 Tax=Oceanobacter sp. 5_MG-2023 TaxID=3062645 RepID=UPI0026E32206|nr:type I-E CRISPR-associated protein Cas5/CasD [Oceanobacter sp. 5_MG-2023]MDO6681059.1 type I-E CRISPR-associated protein Cas5/CasD [Oceanobacter sp. 5_MG-2023]
MEYLVFRLYGPMASWGQAAVGGDRPTAMAPGRAAIIGLLGAALGVKRDDEAGQQRLFDTIVVAVKQLGAGTLLRDYHTVQAPSTDKKFTHYSRKSELAGPKEKLNTVLSSRHYRLDGVWVVAISLSQHSAELTLEYLQAKLQRPVFPLYLGRKSCPLALPLTPMLVSTDQLKHALDTEFPAIVGRDGVGSDVHTSVATDRYWLGMGKQATYYWQGELVDLDGERHDDTLTYHPWDNPISRSRWQFGQRRQHQLTLMEDR